MFEEYLKVIHAKNYMGTDDDMPDKFETWISELTNGELIEYGNYALKQASAKVMGSIKSEKKSASSRNNGKLGGRPKKLTTQH